MGDGYRVDHRGGSFDIFCSQERKGSFLDGLLGNGLPSRDIRKLVRKVGPGSG